MVLSQWIWSTCLLLMPLIMVNGLIDVVSIPRITLFLVINTLVGSLILFKEKQAFLNHSQHFFSGLLGMGLCIYLGVGALSLSNALSLSDGIVEWLKMFSWVGAILLGSFLLKDKNGSLLFVKASILAILVVGLIGLWEFISIIDQLDQDKILYRVNATFEHKNLLATGLLLSLPFGFLLYQQSSEKLWKGLAIGTNGISLVLILITQSRAAWFAMIIAFGFVVLMFLLTPSKRKQIRQPKYWGIIGGGIIVGMGLIWGLSSREIIANAPIDRMQAIFTYEDTKNEHTETIKERLLLWENTIAMIKAYPLLGVGLGNWKIHFPKYRINGLRSEQGQVFFQRPHNDYLWVMSEIGVIGGAVYLTILLATLWYSFLLLRRDEVQESTDYYSILAITTGMVAFILFSLVDFPKERPIHLLWSGLWMAYIWHYYQLYINVPEKTTGLLGTLVYVLPLIGGLGLLFMGQRWQAEAYAKAGLIARSQQKYPLALSAFTSANHWTYRLDPASTPVSWYQGEALYLQQQLPSALAAFKAANALHPYHLHTLNNLGATYFGLGQLTESKIYFEKVLSFAPHFPDANMNLGAMAYNEGKTTIALKYIGACIPQDYNNKRFVTFLGAISKQYAEKLQKITELKPLYTFIQKFGSQIEWQSTIHQQAHQYNRSYQEQIHLDLLFVAKEEQVITAEKSNKLTSFLNNLSIE